MGRYIRSNMIPKQDHEVSLMAKQTISNYYYNN